MLWYFLWEFFAFCRCFLSYGLCLCYRMVMLCQLPSPIEISHPEGLALKGGQLP